MPLTADLVVPGQSMVAPVKKKLCILFFGHHFCTGSAQKSAHTSVNNCLWHQYFVWHILCGNYRQINSYRWLKKKPCMVCVGISWCTHNAASWRDQINPQNHLPQSLSLLIIRLYRILILHQHQSIYTSGLTKHRNIWPYCSVFKITLNDYFPNT